MSHRPCRMEPSPETTESIADARLEHRLEFARVLAAMIYQDYVTMHPRTDDTRTKPFFDAPAEVQVRFQRIAQFAIALSDPERESLAWHAAAQRTDPREAVQTFLRVLTTGDQPEVSRV